jgi:hypothetical protein
MYKINIPKNVREIFKDTNITELKIIVDDNEYNILSTTTIFHGQILHNRISTIIPGSWCEEILPEVEKPNIGKILAEEFENVKWNKYLRISTINKGFIYISLLSVAYESYAVEGVFEVTKEKSISTGDLEEFINRKISLNGYKDYDFIEHEEDSFTRVEKYIKTHKNSDWVNTKGKSGFVELTGFIDLNDMKDTDLYNYTRLYLSSYRLNSNA